MEFSFSFFYGLHRFGALLCGMHYTLARRYIWFIERDGEREESTVRHADRECWWRSSPCRVDEFWPSEFRSLPLAKQTVRQSNETTTSLSLSVSLSVSSYRIVSDSSWRLEWNLTQFAFFHACLESRVCISRLHYTTIRRTCFPLCFWTCFFSSVVQLFNVKANAKWPS